MKTFRRATDKWIYRAIKTRPALLRTQPSIQWEPAALSRG